MGVYGRQKMSKVIIFHAYCEMFLYDRCENIHKFR